MTNRDRLTELFKKALLKWEKLRNDYLEEKIDDIDNFNDVIIDYLLANGVILPPCKVGDKVYVVDSDYETILTMKIESITIEEDGISLTIWNDEEMHSWSCFVDEMALDDAYFTREEAEKVLKEREKNNDSN